MTGIGAVETLPGGQKLAALAARTRGDPAAIRAIASRWRKAASGLTGPLTTLGTCLDGVDTVWQGDSADAFVTYMRRYGRAGDALGDALTGCAGALDTAAGAMETARKSVEAVCDDLLAWVAEYRRLNPHATGERLKPGITEQVDRAVSLARGYVEAAETALSGVTRAIDKALRGATPAFSSIPPAAGQPFVPGAGHSTQWTPVPENRLDPAVRGDTGGGPPGHDGAAKGGFGGYGTSGPPPPGGGPAPKGRIAEWIQQAVEILKAHGYPAGKMNVDDIWMIIQHESGGNPHAINTWDSNAAAGHPSKGLMQTIDPTFTRWSLPGYKDIYDPVDNIVAGVRYAIERYGSVSNVPGVVGTKNGAGYTGY